MGALVVGALTLFCTDAVQAATDCSWNEPGRDPYTGSTHRAIMSFEGIPAWDRLALIGRVWFGLRNDVVAIGQSGVTGRASVEYGHSVRDMHFGRNSKCASVTRAAWPAAHIELADSYRVGNVCVLRPHVCGNLAWTTCDRRDDPVIQAPLDVERQARAVSEPSTLWMVVAASAAGAFIRRRVLQ